LKSILIDSDILIKVSRAKDTAILAKWDDLSRGNTALLCSPVTVAELWDGARQTEHKILDALFAAIRCVPIDLEIGRQAGEYLR
jgi:predicted nucleic acid-binding protein